MNIFTDIHEHEWKDKSLNFLLISLCWFGGVALLMSLLRAERTELQLSHYVQLAVYVLIIITTLNKHRLSIKVKAINIIITTTLVSFVGVYNWGLYSASYFWLLFTPLLLTLFFSHQKALWFVGITVLFMLFCTYMYTSGQLALPIDADEYQTMYASWGTVLFGDVFMMIMLIVVLSNMKQHIIQLIADLEEKQQQIIHTAEHDDLTELPIFRVIKLKLNEMLKNQHREKRNIGVLFMDLDGFKTLNDTYGHDAGDFILKEVTKRIKKCIRGQDMVSRMGGDEFVALCSSPEETHLDIEKVASRIIESVSKPIEYNGATLNVGISIGISIYNTETTGSAEEMIKQADMTMYEVKRSGKNFYKFA